jgi:transcriptional regulator with XRE-family HTH domain
MSQEKLAELADLHRTYISQIERGLKSPSLKALVAIADSLEMKPHALLKEMECILDAG